MIAVGLIESQEAIGLCHPSLDATVTLDGHLHALDAGLDGPQCLCILEHALPNG
jgi:hypothetical protein